MRARGPFDVVLAGDCCYCPEAVAPLLQTVWRLCGTETRVYLCGIVGDPSLAAFRANVGRWFHVARLDETAAAAVLPEEEPRASPAVARAPHEKDAALLRSRAALLRSR